MTLIIEDGSIVPGAESYATAAELAAFAPKYGRTIPATESAQEALLRRAMLLMDSYPWIGVTQQSYQPVSWPRADVVYRDYLIPNNTIPSQIKLGQMALACDLYEEDQNDPWIGRGPMIRRKLADLEQEFAELPLADRKRLERKQSESFFTGFLQPSGMMRVARA